MPATLRTFMLSVLFLLGSGLDSRADNFTSFGPFADRTAGDYTQHGSVHVSGGSGLSGSGNAFIYTRVGAGRSARIRIRGTVKVVGARRPFATIIALSRKNTAAVTNLAPGIDDGRSAKNGTYTAGASRIVATIPFVFGTTQGEASYVITARGRKIRVIETLKTTALTSPVVWRFSGALQR